MNFSKIISLALVGVVSALVIVQAGQYGGSSSASYNEGLAHYGGGSCHGYGCNNQAPRPSHGPYGPYHSYAVRPVIYGGHGMYHYKGYARHAPAPAMKHQRYARSYGMAPRRHPAPAYGCHGHHCGGNAPARHYNAAPAPQYHHAPAQHYNAAPARHYRAAPAYHHMKPIKAILLIAEHPAPTSSYDHHHQGGASYGSGHASAHGASHYGAANTHAQQQSRHHGGHHGQSYGNHGGY